MGEPRDAGDVGAKAVDKRDLGERGRWRFGVRWSIRSWRFAAFEEIDVCAARLLREQDLPHGWEFEIAHHDVRTAVFE